ncbi:MAG TPA: hypothetical protein VGQ89_03260 [Candidatus Limnocylindrales bacterium]|jgi:hypothetical protein|nr:hypothetical protein [Candidatus Limnocylindrales bacterium]
MADKDARPPGEERDGDILAVRAKVTEEQALQLLGRGDLDYGDRAHFSLEPDGTGRLDLFVSRDQIEGLRGEGIEVEIVNNQSARSRERMAEVGEGDRFDGGKVLPTGIGRKVGGRSSRRQPPVSPTTPEGGPEPRS